MKTTLNRVELLEGLKKLSNVIETKVKYPIFLGVKFETVLKDKLLLTVGNNEAIATIEIESIQNELTGSFVVNFKLLNDFLKKSKADQITIEQLDEKVSIQALNIDYKLNYNDAELFPNTPNYNKFTDFITLSNEDYTKAINNTAFAVSKSDSRPVLKGVQIVTENNQIRFIGTDSHRMGRYTTNINNDNNYEAILDGKTLQKTLKMLDKKNETISIALEENTSIIKFDNVVMYIKNIEGNYPDTSRLFPDSFSTEVELNTKETLESVSMLSTIAKEDRNNVIRMELNGHVEMNSNSPEIGDMTAHLNATKQGEDLKISFSALYFAESLKAINEKNVKISFVGNMRPFILNSSDNKATQLILPVRTY